jgi:hypothetical protein
MDLVKFLPRCWQHPTSDFYERQEDGKMMAMFPRYWAVEGVEEVAESPYAVQSPASRKQLELILFCPQRGGSRPLRDSGQYVGSHFCRQHQSWRKARPAPKGVLRRPTIGDPRS